MAEYSNVMMIIDVLRTPKVPPNDFGVFILFSTAITFVLNWNNRNIISEHDFIYIPIKILTTPTASRANNVVPKKSGKFRAVPMASRSLGDLMPSNT